MRWLLRLLLFWGITLPLFYLFGLPALLDMLSGKVRADAYAQCFTQLKEQNLFGTPAAILKPEQAERYCHCVSDPLTITRGDLPELMKQQPPARLTTGMKPVIEACNTALTASINADVTAASPPRSGVQPDGTEVIYFDAPVQMKVTQ